MKPAVVRPTGLVDTQAAFDQLIDELAGVAEFAIDTEFHRERSYYPHLALVQIAWEGGLVLVDPLAVDVSGLSSVFGSDSLPVLHAADQDLEVLERACGSLPAAIFDTQLCAGFLGYSSPSLLTLAESVLRVRLQKGDQLTDWMRRPLSENQMAYAAGDVAWLLELKSVIAGKLEESGRTQWAAEECALLLAKNRSDTVPEEAWWRLPHARQLRGASRGVAQEICGWRERRAQRLDLPVRFIVSDLAVLSIAQRPPSSREDLLRTRGVDARHISGAIGDELFEAVRRGRALASSEMRLPTAHVFERPNRPVIALAGAYVGQRASELSIDPAILATRADLVAFFQDQPSGRLASGWRCGLLGKMLKRLADGDAALAFDGADALVLEERSRRPLSPEFDD
ncbi:MAG: ribonuclease D [Acidimicrobiales bacterium]|jgi:ribonuclease D